MNPWKPWSALAASFALALAAACSNTPGDNLACVPTVCGSGQTMNLCTTSDSGGKCTGIRYQVGSSTFDCASCGNCSAAASQAAAACSSSSGNSGDDGGSVDKNGDGASNSQGNCAARTPCGTGGATYQECTTLDASGACSAIVYETSTGKTFSCAGCSCGNAAEELSTYCASTSSSGSDAGSGGTPVTTCAASVACGEDGLSYELCTTSVNGACKSQSYQVSDGASYACAGCGSCAAATSSLDALCASQTTGSTNCAGTTSCGNGGVTYEVCTVTSASTCESIYYQTSDGEEYDCDECSDCTTAIEELDSYCDSLTSTTGQTCGVAVCGSAATCCDCSGTPECFSLIGGETCASFGCE